MYVYEASFIVSWRKRRSDSDFLCGWKWSGNGWVVGVGGTVALSLGERIRRRNARSELQHSREEGIHVLWRRPAILGSEAGIFVSKPLIHKSRLWRLCPESLMDL